MARAFWKTEVLRPDRVRESWQLEQSEEALLWYLDWLAACEQANADHRSLPEAIRVAVDAAGARRGLAARFALPIPRPHQDPSCLSAFV
ncbi:MAG: hypothetical protein AAF236_06445 [Verrucomicrobiota bacterium]